eukprot:Sspe_Gene.74264::Locus_45857_Transcript_1_1_Confidence_1.000_Length_458::g.74264::m.74264
MKRGVGNQGRGGGVSGDSKQPPSSHTFREDRYKGWCKKKGWRGQWGTFFSSPSPFASEPLTPSPLRDSNPGPGEMKSKGGGGGRGVSTQPQLCLWRLVAFHTLGQTP